MIKRVALARALALDPEIVFLDEPTSGLDPIGAGDFDDLIRTLQRTLGLTVFMVTHDLDSLHTVCDRIAVLADGKVIAAGPMATMLASEHPWLKAYFHGKRAGVAARIEGALLRMHGVDGNESELRPDRLVHARGRSPARSASSTGSNMSASATGRPIASCSKARCRACAPAASVLFNGIRVGEVTELTLDPQAPTQVVADDLGRQARGGARRHRVGLDFQGLTGIAGIALRGGSEQAPPPVDNVLKADATAAADVTQAARDVLRKLDGFISDNDQSAAHIAQEHRDLQSDAGRQFRPHQSHHRRCREPDRQRRTSRASSPRQRGRSVPRPTISTNAPPTFPRAWNGSARSACASGSASRSRGDGRWARSNARSRTSTRIRAGYCSAARRPRRAPARTPAPGGEG